MSKGCCGTQAWRDIVLRGFGCHGCGVALGRLSAAAATLYYFVWDVTSEGRGLSRPRFLVWVVCSSPHAHRSWAGQPMLDSISSQQLRVSGGSSPCQNNEVAHAVQQAWTSSGYKKSHPSLPAQAGFAGKLGRDSLKSGNTDPGEWLPIVLLALRRGQYGKTQRTSSGDSFEMLNLQATTQGLCWAAPPHRLGPNPARRDEKLSFMIQVQNHWEPCMDASVRAISRTTAALHREKESWRAAQAHANKSRKADVQAANATADKVKEAQQNYDACRASPQTTAEWKVRKLHLQLAVRRLHSKLSQQVQALAAPEVIPENEWARSEELEELDRDYFRLKRLQAMERNTPEHKKLAKQLISQQLLARAYLEPVFTVQLRCGRRMCVLLEDGRVSLEATGEHIERALLLCP